MKRWIAGCIFAAALFAQSDENSAGRAVARISLLNGDVSVKRGDSTDVVAAAINAPLLTGDIVATGPNSRVEIQFDYYHRIRLAEDSEVRLNDLENHRYLLQLTHGTATFSAIKGGDAQVEISTPGAAVRPVAHGQYRITVTPDQTAEITVRSGEAQVHTPRGSQTLRSGRTMLVRANPGADAEFQFVAAIPKDSWDDFNRNRDRELERGAGSYRYVSRDVYGAEDLYDQGDWIYTAPYGYVWRPYVSIGWAPYRYGRWAWIDYYGWNWVSYDPWGWAPYHYGRWFNSGGSWCWWPGGMYDHHYWSPGLVAFFGWGHGSFGFGLGFGNYGWVPLAPYERMYPWWGSHYYGGYRHAGFVQNNVTVVNNYNIVNNYRNARVDNGVSVSDGVEFSRGAAGRALRGAESRELARATLVQGAVPASPERGSLRYSDRETRVAAGSRNAGDTRYFSRSTPSRIDRVPFEQQQRALSAGEGGRGTSSGGWRTAEEAARPGRGGREWQTFGTPGGASPRTGDNAGSRGWSTFGDPGRSTAPAAREERGRSTWSTGGGRSEGRSEGRVERSAPETGSRGGWSTGGSSRNEGRGEGRIERSAPAPSPSPRYESAPTRSAPSPSPRYESAPMRSAPSPSPRYESAPTRSAPPPSASPRGESGGGMRSAPSSEGRGGGGGGATRGGGEGGRTGGRGGR